MQEQEDSSRIHPSLAPPAFARQGPDISTRAFWVGKQNFLILSTTDESSWSIFTGSTHTTYGLTRITVECICNLRLSTQLILITHLVVQGSTNRVAPRSSSHAPKRVFIRNSMEHTEVRHSVSHMDRSARGRLPTGFPCALARLPSSPKPRSTTYR